MQRLTNVIYAIYISTCTICGKQPERSSERRASHQRIWNTADAGRELLNYRLSNKPFNFTCIESLPVLCSPLTVHSLVVLRSVQQTACQAMNRSTPECLLVPSPCCFGFVKSRLLLSFNVVPLDLLLQIPT